MDSTTIRVDSDFKGTREFQKSTSVLFKSMSRNKKWELKCSRFLFRIRDFMLNPDPSMITDCNTLAQEKLGLNVQVLS